MISATRLALTRVFRLIKVIALRDRTLKRSPSVTLCYRRSLNLGQVLVEMCLTDYAAMTDLIKAKFPALEKPFDFDL